MTEIYIIGLLITGTLLGIWETFTPPPKWTRGSYTDHEGWVVYAATQLGLLGRLLTCPFCLSVHLSFWVSLGLAVSFTTTLQEGGLLVVGSLGWPYVLSTITRWTKRNVELPKIIPETKDIPDDKTPKITEAQIEARKEFLKKRGITGSVNPTTGEILVEKVEPVHQKINNLLRDDTSMDRCFFPGCETFLQPLIDKIKTAQSGECPSCELGAFRQKTYDNIVAHLKENNLYEGLNR